jgi:hypothetical protein
LSIVYGSENSKILQKATACMIGFNYFIPLLIMTIAYGAVSRTLLKNIRESKRLKAVPG